MGVQLTPRRVLHVMVRGTASAGLAARQTEHSRRGPREKAVSASRMNNNCPKQKLNPHTLHLHTLNPHTLGAGRIGAATVAKMAMTHRSFSRTCLCCAPTTHSQQTRPPTGSGKQRLETAAHWYASARQDSQLPGEYCISGSPDLYRSPKTVTGPKSESPPVPLR